jgi:hypothetical protein
LHAASRPATYKGGDHQVCGMVRVPSPEAEDAKRPHRERECEFRSIVITDSI